MSSKKVLIGGDWRDADSSGTFQAHNPATRTPLADQYPVSSWADCEAALASASEAAPLIRSLPCNQIATFLERFAERIEFRKDELVEMANAETAYPASPRLADVELPRTTNQLRQAGGAARDGSWTRPIIDTEANIRSCLSPLGPICIFGPNNFPFAFGSLSGGDFAAAVAAGNPVIGKANSSHPGTTRIFGEEAQSAAADTKMPPGTIQLLYRTSHRDGERLVSDSRIGATAYTGSRSAGLALKAAADSSGKPIYLELSSVNPVLILPGALREKLDDIAEEFTTSCLMGTGQFCTNPGLVLMLKEVETETFIENIRERFANAPVGTLLSAGVESSLRENVETLIAAGAESIVGNSAGGGSGFSFANSLLRISGTDFLSSPGKLQTEAFGNASLLVIAEDLSQACQVIDSFEGNLTGCVYTDTQGSDDEEYDFMVSRLRGRVGRLLNDKMPTGVAVSPAMNHGGPYPATGHPGFTAVGIPTSISRFASLDCYDNVRPHRLPPCLQDKNPTGNLWRQIDGAWTRENVNP